MGKQTTLAAYARKQRVLQTAAFTAAAIVLAIDLRIINPAANVVEAEEPPKSASADAAPIVITAPPWVTLTNPEGEVPVPSAPNASSSDAPAAVESGRSGKITPTVTSGESAFGGLPEIAYRAYQSAARMLATEQPGCGIDWALIAGIGRVESNHGRYGGAQLRADGTTSRPIRGLLLVGGPGLARILDTDGGVLDGSSAFDRAVGPMQFLPGTWRAVFPAGNPDNIFDAALATGRYLCAGGGDLRTDAGQRAAVFRYNHSQAYVNLVMATAAAYRNTAVSLVTDTVPVAYSTPVPAARTPVPVVVPSVQPVPSSTVASTTLAEVPPSTSAVSTTTPVSTSASVPPSTPATTSVPTSPSATDAIAPSSSSVTDTSAAEAATTDPAPAGQ